MATDRNVRATVGASFLLGGPAISVAVWAAVRNEASGPPWSNPIVDLGLVVGLAGAVILLSLLPWRGWWRRIRPPKSTQRLGPAPFIRQADKSYRAIPRLTLEGEGIERSLRATLHEVGDGWARGVRCEIRDPRGAVAAHEWHGTDSAAMRKELAEEGNLVGAVRPGHYTATWWGIGTSIQKDELIDSFQIEVPPVGLPDWEASHTWLEGLPLLLRCTPPKDAESRVSMMVQGPMGRHSIQPWDPRFMTGVHPPGIAGADGRFNDYHFVTYPDSFDDLKVQRLKDGYYGVEWRVERGLGSAVACLDRFVVRGGIPADAE